MRTVAAFFALIVVIGVPLHVRGQAKPRFEWDRWRELPVQNGGRIKPLDTVAAETLRLIANRSDFHDPQSGMTLNPTALYLSMLFEWQGWDRKERDRLLTQMNWGPEYFRLHDSDKWDSAPLLRVDHLGLRSLVGLAKNQTHISPIALSQAIMVEPGSQRKVRFPTWCENLLQKDAHGTVLDPLETQALELANHLWTYQNHRMGRGLDILPNKDADAHEGMPLAHLLLTRFDDANDATGDCREAQRLLCQARAAFLAGDAASFDQSADEVKAVLRRLGSQLGPYPSGVWMRLEVAYNRWMPFRIAWVLMLAALVGQLLHLGSKWKWLNVVSLTAYGSATAAMVTGFACRILIAGRPPVTNMYESVIYMGFGVVVFGAIFGAIYRQKYILMAAAAVSTVALVLADNSPALLDSSVRPLEPVLRSNFWLVTHVMTITLSYAAFALALGMANITLGYFLVGSTNGSAISALSRFTYKAIQIGVLLLAAGIILGGVWADYSWGRFWGWDPKEVWALVALLGYLCVLHARLAGWVGHRGLAALAVVCFALVIIAWYGVNFVLGAGLHSYGFGGGGQGWVYTAIALQFAYVGAALWRAQAHDPAEMLQLPSHQSPEEVSTATGAIAK